MVATSVSNLYGIKEYLASLVFYHCSTKFAHNGVFALCFTCTLLPSH